MLNNKFKLAFIGGSIHSAVGYTHFVSATMDNQWEIVAGSFSSDSVKNHESAHVYGVPSNRTYENWQLLLDQEAKNLDAVVVLLPTPDHFEVVEYCIKMCIPVICEKALTVSSNQAKLLMDLANKFNSFVSVIYNYSTYPMVRELKNIINNGRIGRVLHFHIEMPQEGFIRTDSLGNKPSPQKWRLHDDFIPTIHLDLAVHMHQMISFLIDQKPEYVIADQSSNGWFREVVDDVNAMVRYSNGIKGLYWFSKCSLGHRNGLKVRIYGTNGSAEWVQSNPEELFVSYANGRREIIDRASESSTIGLVQKYHRFKAGHPAGFVEAFANLYKDTHEFLDAYKKSGSARDNKYYNIETAYEGLVFLEAMQKSVLSNKWEKIESI